MANKSENKFWIDYIIDEFTCSINDNIAKLHDVYNNQANEEQQKRIEDYFSALMNKKAESKNNKPKTKKPIKE